MNFQLDPVAFNTALQASQPDLYLVICGKYDDPYVPERNLSDMTRAGTIKDISDAQFPSLRTVIEVGTGRDVTEDIAQDVCGMWAISGDPIDRWQRDFIETHLGVQIANEFAGEDA